MVRKKGINIIVIILGILLTIFLLNYFGIFDDLKTKPITFSIVEPKTEKNSPYTCPSGTNIRCNVRGVMECNLPKTGEKVISRVDDSDFSDGWIALYDSISESLQSWCYGTKLSWIPINPKEINLPYNTKGILASGPFSPCRSPSKCIFILHKSQKYYWEYHPTRVCGADLTPTPKYDCVNQELCENFTNKYSCSGEFKVEKSADDKTLVFPIENLSYSSNTRKGRDYSEQKTISPGNIVYVTGGDKNLVEVEVVDITQECTQSECNDEKTGYYECINKKLSNNLIYCNTSVGQICKQAGVNGNAKCVEPYIVEIAIKDDSGFTRNSFQKDKPIKIYVTIKSDTTISGEVTLDIRERSVQGISAITPMKSTFSSNSLNNSLNIFNLNQGLPLAITYYIVLKIDYPGLKDPNYYGLELNEFKTIEIVDQFTAILRISQNLGGVPQTSPPFYLGYPIIIEYLFQETGDTPTYPQNATVTYQIGAGQKIQLQKQSESHDNKYGYWRYGFTPSIEGIYKFEGVANRGKFITPPSVEYFQINEDEVVVNYKISHNPVQINKLYSGFLTFTTKNRNKDLIETSNAIKVSINGVDSGTVPVLGSGGQYLVDYTFTKDNSAYVFFIGSAPSQGNLKTANLSTVIIKSGKEEEEFCKSDSECGTFGICKGGNCETNVTMIITIFVGGFILLIILYMGYKFYQNRKIQPSFGGDFGGL